MSTIAKGKITLVSINDAYTVSLSPESCIIKADFDGSNPRLENAKSVITVNRGSKSIKFKIVATSHSSGISKFVYTEGISDNHSISITSIDNSEVDGWLDLTLLTADKYNYRTTVRFAYTVIRESTMLDWIQDWEGSKTKVGGTYIMTPKLFVGKKEDIVESIDGATQWKKGALTGVYIGPDLLIDGNSSVGIYGYLKDSEIFHLNANGGFVAGWNFNEGGLESSNSIVKILSEGSIIAQNPKNTNPYWAIYANGNAQFANGNIKFFADGSAEFVGNITSTSGNIAGWTISNNQIKNKRIGLDSKETIIGVWTQDYLTNVGENEPAIKHNIKYSGGVGIYYTDLNDYGLIAYTPGTASTPGNKIISLGSTNYIAGWNLNHQAIWSGSNNPYLTQGGFTTETDAITLSPNGLRSCKWFVDSNGTAAFVGGTVKFNTDNAEMFGWLMRSNRFSSSHAALVSDSNNCGLFVSPSDISEVGVTNLISTVNSKGGICIYSDGTKSTMKAYDNKGNLGFQLSTSDYNKIAEWYFNSSALYVGSSDLTQDEFTTKSSSMALLVSGIYGFKWKLKADGSGAIAGGNIVWDTEGNVSFTDKVTLSWNNISGAVGNRFTYIDSTGIYTGTISADSITAGTITSASIKCEGKWALNTDGSGFLASNNIFWGINGNLNVNANISVRTLRYIKSDEYDLTNPEGSLINDAFVAINLGGDQVFRLPHLEKGEFRTIKFLGAVVSRTTSNIILKVDNTSDAMVIGTNTALGTKYKELDFGNEAVVEQLNGGAGYFELIGNGSGLSDGTLWYIIPLYT